MCIQSAQLIFVAAKNLPYMPPGKLNIITTAEEQLGECATRAPRVHLANTEIAPPALNMVVMHEKKN